MDEIVWPIADLLKWTFKLLPAAGNAPNIAALLLGIIGLIYWLRLQARYDREAEERGTLK